VGGVSCGSGGGGGGLCVGVKSIFISSLFPARINRIKSNGKTKTLSSDPSQFGRLTPSLLPSLFSRHLFCDAAPLFFTFFPPSPLTAAVGQPGPQVHPAPHPRTPPHDPSTTPYYGRRTRTPRTPIPRPRITRTMQAHAQELERLAQAALELEACLVSASLAKAASDQRADAAALVTPNY
jgi:hypothetical protein